jgi:hypothetical protein
VRRHPHQQAQAKKNAEKKARQEAKAKENKSKSLREDKGDRKRASTVNHKEAFKAKLLAWEEKDWTHHTHRLAREVRQLR